MTSEPFRAPPPGHTLPYDDGEPMESERHQLQMTLLTSSLRDVHFAGRRDVYVAANMGVYFSELQAKKNDFRAPDVFVVLDAEYVRKHTVEGFRFDPIRHDFVPIAPDARGDVKSEQLDLSLGWRGESWTMAPPPWLRWVRGDGTPVPAPSELATRTREAESRAVALEARIAELEARQK